MEPINFFSSGEGPRVSFRTVSAPVPQVDGSQTDEAGERATTGGERRRRIGPRPRS